MFLSTEVWPDDVSDHIELPSKSANKIDKYYQLIIMDIHNTNFISFNCKSIKRSVDGVRELCDIADIIALQETWLLPHDLPFLDSIHADFASTGTSAVDTEGQAVWWSCAQISVSKCVSVNMCKSANLSNTCCDERLLCVSAKCLHARRLQ